MVHDADADLGDELAASAMPTAAGATTRRLTGGQCRRAVAGRQRRTPRPAQRRRRDGPRAVPTAVSRSTDTDAGRYRRAKMGNGSSASMVNHCECCGRGRVRMITSPRNPKRATSADQQPAQIEPADVLHRRPAGLHDLAAVGDVAGLQQHVANGPVAQSADAAAPDRQRTADRAAGRQGDALPDLGQRSIDVVDRRACAAAHGHLVGLDPLDARRRSHRANPGHRTAACAEPGDRHRIGCADFIGERRQIHAPSGTCCRSAHDAAVGSTLLGLARPVVSNERRRRAWASRSTGAEHQRHEVALLQTRCRARPTALRRLPRRRERSPHRRHGHDPSRRARACRTPAAGAGCRRRRGTRSSPAS